MYIVHNKNDLRTKNNREMNRSTPRPKRYWPESLTDHLLRNEGVDSLGHPYFRNVSAEMGITHKGFGLGVGITDFNNDQLIDVYVSNDFVTEDLLYINRAHKDSTLPRFDEQNKDYLCHQTENGMGMDIADLNDDGLPDIMVVDMLPEDYVRKKRVLSGMNYYTYLVRRENDYTTQYMRNTVQMSNGFLNGQPVKSSEVSFLNGLSSTDWSWAPLLVDFDNDGDKDIFVSNGYAKDVIDLDYIHFTTSKNTVFNPKKDQKKKYVDMLPSIEVPNYFYEQTEEGGFNNVSAQWIVPEPSLSSGVAYADFDLDGDLDMAVNNINKPAYLLENKISGKPEHHYLRVRLQGGKNNPDAIGAKLVLYAQGKEQHQFQSVIRGYMSSMEPVVHFGTSSSVIDSLKVVWPDGRESVVRNLQSDQTLELSDDQAVPGHRGQKKENLWFANVAGVLDYRHVENMHNEYDKQPLLLRQYSQTGPCIAVADVDGVPGDEIFIGGSVQQAGTIWFQGEDGEYRIRQVLDSIYEDTDAVFFDADLDKDPDLYVVSGGNEFQENSPYYQDRLYLNDGKGNFTLSTEVALSNRSGSCVRPIDLDHDQDLDIFVGSRISPLQYPKIPESFIWRNSNGKFTMEKLEGSSELGMISDALWVDLDKDGWEDLVLVGEYMAITIYENKQGKLQKMETTWLDTNDKITGSEGWWQCIEAADFDQDGDMDLIAGNQGLNTQVKPEEGYPLYLYTKDFDQNGTLDPVIGQYFDHDGKKVLFPVHTRDDLKAHFPETTIHFFTYEEFAKMDFLSLFQIKDLEEETIKATVFSSSFIENLGQGKFRIVPLPRDCQVAPVNDILIGDFDGDALPDALLVGNDYSAESNYGRFDAFTGLLLKRTSDGFTVVPSRNSGFHVPQQSNHILSLTDNTGRTLILAAQNDTEARVFEPRIKNVPQLAKP